MSTNVSWPTIGGTTYPVPAAGEVSWANLSNYLIALAQAQGTTSQKVGSRIATSTPVTVASATDCLVISDLAAPGAVAVNLPAGVNGQMFALLDGKGDALTNNITITPNGAETINSGASYVLNKNNAGLIVVFKGTNWYILSEFTNISGGAILRSDISAGTPGYVVFNNGSTGLLDEEQFLSKTRGGTGITSTAVFPSSGDIITRTSTDTGANRLQSKDLDDDSVRFVDSGDTTKVIEVEASGSTTGTTTTIASVSTASRVVTLPNASTVLVGRDTSDTGASRLQNKDLDASNSKFVDSSDTTKTVKFDASGASTGTSATLTSVTTANRVYTLPDATTSIVGTNTVQVITEKDIDGGVASNARRLTLPSNTYANLLALTRKEGTILYGTDTDVVYYDDGVDLVPVGSGSGSGEINAVTNPSATTNTDGWVASGSATVTRVTSGSPLDPVTPTAFELDLGAAADDVDVDFTLPVGLENTKLKVEWYQLPEVGAVSGEWKIELWDQAETTEYPLSTDSSGDSLIPALTGKYTSYFMTDGTNTLRVKFIRVSGANYLRVTNLIVGPGIQPSGGIVEDSSLYTPSAGVNQGLGTLAASEMYSTRIGSTSLIEGKITLGTVAAAEARLALPDNMTVGAITGNHVVGRWYRANTSATTTKAGVIIANQGDAYLLFSSDDYTGTQSPLTAQNGDDLFSSSDVLSIENVLIPIAEWSGSGVLQLAENAVEYVSNSSTSDADDTTSFAYGPSGSLVPTINSAVSALSRAKRVSFNSPVLITDIVTIEVLIDTGASELHWVPVETSGDYIGSIRTESSIAYGIFWTPVTGTSNQIDVRFNRGGRTIGNVLGNNGSNYPGTPQDRWRVRKVSQNGALGFAEASSLGTGLAGPAGSYTPVGTLGTNVSSFTGITSDYIKVGKKVICTGHAAVSATGSGASLVRVTLPFSSAIAASTDVKGVVSGSTSADFLTGFAEGDVGTGEANLRFFASAGTSYDISWTFTYEIL